MLRKVEEFHLKFGHPVEPKPTVPTSKIRKLRVDLIKEELDEFTQASMDGDLVEVADGLADLLYVVLGACLAWGIPIEKVFNEVHRSNMSKVWPCGKVRLREDGKVLKPPSYSPPEIKPILEEA